MGSRSRRVAAAGILMLVMAGAALAQRISDHPIMHTLYDVKDVPQVSSINFWRRTPGSAKEKITNASAGFRRPATPSASTSSSTR